jgi:hypothetical protein
MAAETVAGNFGGVLQVDADDARLITSQVSVTDELPDDPPQLSSLENSLKKKFRLGYVS